MDQEASLRRRNRLVAGGAALTVVAMVGMAFAAVPLYRLFCSATGYNGTPQIGGTPSAEGTRVLTIRFNANTQPDLPWRFGPEQPSTQLRVGEQGVAFYEATNRGGSAVTGTALYNVTPDVVGRYFHKTQCFCFNEQTLRPGEHAQFPVAFWVDPAIATDPDTRDIRTVTLSYTFFRSLDDAQRSGALAKAGPMARADDRPPGTAQGAPQVEGASQAQGASQAEGAPQVR